MRPELSIPHSIETEQALLGSIIENNDLLSDVIRIISPESFYKPAHQHIYRAMLELDSAKNPIDEVILGDQLKSLNQLDEAGGYAYLAELVECVPSSCHMVYYAKIIQEHALLRDLISVTTEIGRKSRNPEQNISELLAEAEQKISEIASTRSAGGPRHIKDVLAEEFQKLEVRSENPDGLAGLSTGYTDLDRMMSGLIPQDLITVAARPSMGKTAFALNIASYVATHGETDGAILVFTREMSEGQSALRMLSSDGKVTTQKLKNGNLESEDWDRLAMSTERLSIAGIYLDDRSSNISQIVHESRGIHKCHKGGVALIIVDYLQLLEGTNERNREQEVAKISRAMKMLAKELNVPIIQLSQLNRDLEKRKDKRPIMSDLRESGAIEQDSDIIIFLYRDEIYDEDSPDKGIAEVIIAKHRNGPPGMIKLAFLGKYTKFVNLSRQEPPPKPMKPPKQVNHREHWQEKAS